MRIPASLDEEGGHEFPAAGDADLSEDVAQVLLRRTAKWRRPSGGGMPPQDEFGDLSVAQESTCRSPLPRRQVLTAGRTDDDAHACRSCQARSGRRARSPSVH